MMESQILKCSMWHRIGTKYPLKLSRGVRWRYFDTLLQYHDEYMSVTEGRLEVTVEGITRIIIAGDDPAFIPRWHVHSMKGFKGEKLVFQEKAVPAGPTKALLVFPSPPPMALGGC